MMKSEAEFFEYFFNDTIYILRLSYIGNEGRNFFRLCFNHNLHTLSPPN
nr:MAG TPA: hypothetical protein [Caudoviricetes sp.]